MVRTCTHLQTSLHWPCLHVHSLRSLERYRLISCAAPIRASITTSAALTSKSVAWSCLCDIQTAAQPEAALHCLRYHLLLPMLACSWRDLIQNMFMLRLWSPRYQRLPYIVNDISPLYSCFCFRVTVTYQRYLCIKYRSRFTYCESTGCMITHCTVAFYMSIRQWLISDTCAGTVLVTAPHQNDNTVCFCHFLSVMSWHTYNVCLAASSLAPLIQIYKEIKISFSASAYAQACWHWLWETLMIRVFWFWLQSTFLCTSQFKVFFHAVQDKYWRIDDGQIARLYQYFSTKWTFCFDMLYKSSCTLQCERSSLISLSVFQKL